MDAEIRAENSASGLDNVLGPRRPVLGRAIAGITSHGIPIIGTGVGRIGQRALVSIARRTGIGGASHVVWISIGRGTGVGGLSRIAWVSIPRRTGVRGV